MCCHCIDAILGIKIYAVLLLVDVIDWLLERYFIYGLFRLWMLYYVVLFLKDDTQKNRNKLVFSVRFQFWYELASAIFFFLILAANTNDDWDLDTRKGIEAMMFLNFISCIISQHV